MKLKVRGGTANSSENLCNSCSKSHISEEDNGLVTTYCDMNHYQIRLINKRIIRCNNWSDLKEVSLYELEKSAWILRTDKLTRKAGFKPYSQLTEAERELVDDEIVKPF